MDGRAGAGTRLEERHAPVRVLVVEDDADVARPLVLALEAEGYDVAWVARGWQALELLRSATAGSRDPIGVVLLDLGLPDLDGIDVCQEARRDGFDGAILIISARGSELDRVAGLDHGADDYLAKPYRLAEVQARVRALLRRTARSAAAEAAAAASVAAAREAARDAARRRVVVDAETRTVLVDGVPVALSGRECDVLRVLAEHPGRAVTREDLVASVWHSGWTGSAKTLDVTVSRLRQRLLAAGIPDQVVAVRGVGYRLDPPEG